MSQDRLDFGEFRLGTPGIEYLEQSFIFKSDTDELVGEPKCSASWVRLLVAPREMGTKEVLVRIPVEQLPPGVGTTEITFHTSSNARPTGAVHIRIAAVPALIVRPPSVFLVGNEVRRAEVFDPNGKPVELVQAESSTPSLTLRMLNRNEIEIQNMNGHAIQESVSIRVKDILGRSVTIRVSAF